MKKLTKIRTIFLIIVLLISFAAIAAEKNETIINGNLIDNLIKKVEFEPQQIHQADPYFYINNTSCYSNTLENDSYLIIGNKRNNDSIKGSAIFSDDNEKGKDDAEITANYEADPMIGSAPLTVNFTDLSFAQNTIFNSWEWDFNNDGVIDSQLQNPEFLFINPGIYNVSLTVSDGNINDSKFGIINVVDVDTTFSFIPFSGLDEDFAGGAAWNTNGLGPEPPASGHFLPPPASISIAYYYLASRDYDNIDPLSTAGLFGNGPSSGFPNFEAALALHGKTIQDINISYGLMSLGNDIEGIDWWMIGDVETRIYRGGIYQFKLNDENLITGDMPDYTQTIVYNLWMGGEDEISGVTGESHSVNNSGGKSPEAQEIAQALMEDIGDDAIRFIFTSTQTANQFEFAGNGRFGGFFENQQGFIIKASTVECELEVDCGEDRFIGSGETVNLEALATDGTEPYTYLWEPADFLDDPAISNPEATPDETTTYTCTVTDFEDCIATASVTIYVDTCDYWFDGLDYTMSFEDVETDRENWTSIDFNPFENEWELYENDADAHTGDYSYKFDYLNTFANDWLFSRCFNLEDNHSYEISFWYKTDSESDFQLDLRLCNELDSLGEFIHRESDAALAYTQIIDTITIGTAGIYYFAWQTIFWGDNIVFVDDINISDLGIIEEIPFPLPFAEFWDSDDFDFNQWTLEPAEGNWMVNSASGYPPPCAYFGMYPYQLNYEFGLESHELEGRNTSQIELSFDLALSNFGNTLEEMSVDVFNGIEWTQIENFTNENDDIPLTNFSYNISEYAVGNIFKIRFVAHGEDSYYIGAWKIDNIIVEETAISQNIILNTGYQFVSSFLEFDDPDIQNLLEDILPNLDFVRNSGGFMLRKIGPNWINGIGDWVNTEGYLFKMLNPDEIEFEGIVTDIQTPIELVTGYQIISFLSSEPMDASLAFESIIGDNLDFVRNSGGFMLRKIGPVWVNGIGDINPGEGLLVKMLNPDTQIYPEIINKSTSDKVFIKNQHFNFEGGNPAEAVYSLYVSGLNIGDEVAVYDGDKMVGASVVISENTLENSIPIFSVLTNGLGYESNNEMTLKVWDAHYQTTVSATYTFNNEYTQAFNKTVFPETDGQYSVLNLTKGSFGMMENATLEVDIYPNPASDVLNIVSNNTITRVRVLNFVGQTMLDNVVNETSLNINTSVYQSGVYIIQIETANGIKTEKVTIK